MHVDGGHRQKPIDFQRRHFQNGRLAAILDFTVSALRRWHGFQSVSQVCFGISISNVKCILMVVIGRSLLIFSDVTFKMAAWWPYWIFWFPDSNFSLALNINSKLKWHNTYTVGTPYNTNVGVQKIPDRAIWKPVVAKRNNTNSWSCPWTPNFSDARLPSAPHGQTARIPRQAWVNFSPRAFITICLTTL